MPGFFVDRQDYASGPLSVTFDNTAGTTANDKQLGIGGTYDFWHDNTVQVSRLARSLQIYADDPCCCPELFCCWPETVTATLTGFQEATRVPSRSIGKYFVCGGGDIPSTDPPKTAGSIVWYEPISWCSASIEENIPARGADCNFNEICNEGVLIRSVFGNTCCPEGSTGIFPPEDARAGRCCIDCSPESSEDGTDGIIPTGEVEEEEENSWESICCTNIEEILNPEDPSNPCFTRCQKPEHLSFSNCSKYKYYCPPDPSLGIDNLFRGQIGNEVTHRDVMWPKSMFPPQSCNCTACCNSIYVGENSTYIDCAGFAAYSVGQYYNIQNSHITKYIPDTLFSTPPVSNYSWSEICSNTQLGLSVLCDKPTSSNIIYGPNSYRSTQSAAGSGPQIYDGDHNGTYVCHKTLQSFRPELEPYIERQVPLSRPETEKDKALLLFEVESRRKLEPSSCACGLGEEADSVIEGFNFFEKYPSPTEQEINAGVVPMGKIYCVDYPCYKAGRTLPTYLDDSRVPQPTVNCIEGQDTGFCGRFQCLADAGSARPKLVLYPWLVNGSGATINFETFPELYVTQNDSFNIDGFPVSWSAKNFTIITEGSGYLVGDVFFVDFDENYQRRIQLPDGTFVWRDGYEYRLPLFVKELDAQASLCNQPTSPIIEKYNTLTPSQLIGFPFVEDDLLPNVNNLPTNLSFSPPHAVQTIRVSETGVNGEIKSIERVPWFKEKEYGFAPECKLIESSKKTPIFPEYGRRLCHPQTVQYGGRGYSVGDKITWLPSVTEQNVGVWKNKYAVGYVVDVDDQGSILDYFINGGYDNLNETTSTSEFGATVRNYSIGSFGNLEISAPVKGHVYNKASEYWSPCYGSAEASFGSALRGKDNDNRGYYYHHGTNLCSLNWTGVGVPIRQRSFRFNDNNSVKKDLYYDGTLQPSLCGGAVIDYNSSYLTSLNLSISRIVAETSVGVNINKYRYIDSVYGGILSTEAGFGNPDVDGPLLRAILDFRPFPECVGGGSEIVPVIYNCSDPTNPNCGNESIFGGSLSGTIIKSPGAFHSFINRKHVEPILPKDIPDIVGISGVGTGATIDTFSFGSVNSFPGPSPDPQTNLKSIFDNPNYLERWTDISYSGLTPDRYAYFPLTNIQIDNPGSGYEIDQEFEIYPENGKPFTRSWVRDTADDPIACPNGGWYEEPYNTVDSNGLWNYTNQNPIILESKAKVKITDVDENGGIISIDIVDKGMMFRCVETTGILHPDVHPYLDSTLGYGAVPNVVIDTNKNSDNFGRVTDFYFTNPVFVVSLDQFGNFVSVQGEDPMHTDITVSPNVYVGWNGSPTKGYGRDYANPDNGYFWMLNNVNIDTDVKLLAYYPFGDGFAGGTLRSQHFPGDVPDNYIHPEYSTHNIIEGTRPNYIPKSTICSFTDCYHELLNRAYPLYRSWTGNNDVSGPGHGAGNIGYNMITDRLEPSGELAPFEERCGVSEPIFGPECQQTTHPFGHDNLREIEGRPSSSFCVLLKNGKSINYDCNPDGSINNEGENTLNYAVGIDYIVVEYGFTMTLSTNMTLNDCPDHTQGRTYDGPVAPGADGYGNDTPDQTL
jgi:hypothetical protein